MNLADKIKKHLPMEVQLKKEVVKQLQKQWKDISVNQRMSVVDAYDTGDSGGIVCVIPRKKEALVVSITPLSIDKNHLLSEQIPAYQHARTLQLMADHCHLKRHSKHEDHKGHNH